MIITCLLPHHPDNRETGYSNILAGLFLSLHLLQQAYISFSSSKHKYFFFRRNVKEEKGGSELHKRSLQVRETLTNILYKMDTWKEIRIIVWTVKVLSLVLPLQNVKFLSLCTIRC